MSNFIKLWELPGGIHPPENKQQSLQLPLGQVPIPPQLFIPLSQHIGSPAKPIVNLGERVLTGELIAVADGVFSANVHASSSGIISAITSHVLPHPSGMSGDVIVIDTDGKHEWIPLEHCEDYLAQENTAENRLKLRDQIHAAGIVGLGGAGFPTAVKLSTKSNLKIDTLVINGAECEPYITADDMLMQVRADDIIKGTLLLSYILNYPKRLVIAVEANKPKAIAALQLAAKQQPAESSHNLVEVVTIPTKYPSGGAKQLIQILTGRELPHGHHSADIGAICVNVATAAAAYRAVRFGEPLISRITTLVGEALTTQQNIDVLLGTPINYLLAQQGFDANKASRVLMGGTMMGFTLLNLSAPAIKTTNCILAASKKELPLPPPAQACIRCGLCAEACPAGLLPQQLFWYAQSENMDRLQSHNLFDCIECGACSYVCPSKIPLVQYYRAAKGSIREHLLDQEKANRSRKRFEFRKERIAKEESEKEAKRAARKKAADEVKLQLAKKHATGIEQTAEKHVEVVATAIAKANYVQTTPTEQRVKLERLLNAAQNSVASARAPLVPQNLEFPITEVQLIQQQSRIKQAELKLLEAQKKLADFDQLQTSHTATAPNESAATIPPDQHTKNYLVNVDVDVDVKTKTSPIENISNNEKHAPQVLALQARLQKARERLAKAETEKDTDIDILRANVTKIEQKMKEITEA